MTHYRIQSQQTDYTEISDGTEHAGDHVYFAPGIAPNKTIVTINPPLGPATLTNVTISGKAGLYASLISNASGKYVAWSHQPYVWTVAHGIGYYEIFVPGEDLYWTNTGTSRIVVLKAGHNTVAKENLFNITPA